MAAVLFDEFHERVRLGVLEQRLAGRIHDEHIAI